MMGSEQYFYEDEVFRLNKRGNLELGMVLQNAEHVSSDEEDEEFRGVVKNGYIRVAWHPSGVEQTLHEKKVGLADRSLMPGDVVRRLIKGKDTQRGYCRSIHVQSDLQALGTNQVITGVNSVDLSPVEKFMPGVVVVLRSWVGTVKSIASQLHLSLPDGARCIISDSDADVLADMEERRFENEFPHRHDYHPGQVLIGTAQELQFAKWLSPTPLKDPKHKNTKFIKMLVDKVETKSVTVHWQCCVYTDNQQQPGNVVKGEDLDHLQLLNVFEACTLQIGDRSLYHLKPTDTVLTKDAWRYRQEWALFDRKNHWRRKTRHYTNDEVDGRSSSKTLNSEGKKSPEVEFDPKSSGAISEGWETDDCDTASASSGCSSNSSAGAGSQTRKKKAGLMTRMLKYKKLRRTRRRPPKISLKPDSSLVVESLMTTSCADVVWQDGTVETGIASTSLYPIHHLDDQEFFPGDFVVENKDSGCLRLYGVVQSVDHVGRLARVTWFHTYVTQQEVRPKQLDTVEVSVYDLKDHPDFQYRPGTVALRVANFDSENQTATVGQVLDNYPEGQVHMWWVDGTTSMSWPQDLYKVGEYDSEEGELWDDNASDGSWETQSEEELQENNIKPLLATNIEKARVSMSRLEDLFTHNPRLQSVAIMQKLLEVYRDCRYLDKLMETSYFHENNFQGLLERVREKNKSSVVGQRISDQIQRLAAPLQCTDTPCSESPTIKPEVRVDRVNQMLESLNIILQKNLPENSESKPSVVIRNSNGSDGRQTTKLVDSVMNLECTSPDLVNDNMKCQSLVNSSPYVINSSNTYFEHVTLKKSPDTNSSGNCPNFGDRSPNAVSQESDKSPISINGGEKSPNSLNSTASGPLVKSSSQDDSGVFDHYPVSADASSSENCDCGTKELASEPRVFVFGASGSRASYGNSEKRGPRLNFSIKHSPSAAAGTPPLSADLSDDGNPCARLCALIKAQLCLAFADVYQRFHGEKPQICLSVEELSQPIVAAEGEGFEVIGQAPLNHKFRLGMSAPPDAAFLKTVRKELSLLRNALPAGIWVKGYEDRMDLYSIMIRGPEKTPYEDGLFLFDVQLPREYPRAPPIFHYHSYCVDRLNPNLYEDGKVCVSLLGTWKGRGTEMWSPNSTILQVIVSIQGLILVKEPYYNEAGYEKQKGSQQGHENSRMYNEMAILKLVQAMTKLSQCPHQDFQNEIRQHFAQNTSKLIERIDKWLDISETYNNCIPLSPGSSCLETDARARNQQWQKSAINVASASDQPDFPLLPASRGFCITMRKTLQGFQSATSKLAGL